MVTKCFLINFSSKNVSCLLCMVPENTNIRTPPPHLPQKGLKIPGGGGGVGRGLKGQKNVKKCLVLFKIGMSTAVGWGEVVLRKIPSVGRWGETWLLAGTTHFVIHVYTCNSNQILCLYLNKCRLNRPFSKMAATDLNELKLN